MKQIGLGIIQFMQDGDEMLPPRIIFLVPGQETSWRAILQPFIKSTAVFQCPDNPSRALPDLGSDGNNASYSVARYDNGSGGPFRDGGGNAPPLGWWPCKRCPVPSWWASPRPATARST